jgi:hypothetical protein
MKSSLTQIQHAGREEEEDEAHTELGSDQYKKNTHTWAQVTKVATYNSECTSHDVILPSGCRLLS